MPAEVKFTSFGIPYLVEFANVTFKKTKTSETPSRMPRRRATVPPPATNLSNRNRNIAAARRSKSLPPLPIASPVTHHVALPSTTSTTTLLSSNASQKTTSSFKSNFRNIMKWPRTKTIDPNASTATIHGTSGKSTSSLMTASSETLSSVQYHELSKSETRSISEEERKREKYYEQSLSPVEEPEVEEELVEEDLGAKEGEGIYIQYASSVRQTVKHNEYPSTPQRLSDTRLSHLKRRIANAVLAVGMDSSIDPIHLDSDDSRLGSVIRHTRFSASTATNSFLAKDSGYGGSHQGSSRVRNGYVKKAEGTLFRGTYGQVMTALNAAGLVTTPCKESGLEVARRLGVLFVASHNEHGALELKKLTLWA
ncbi:hypothetical protein C8Q75DRAFT_810890 [Abortiporus biennis]|nr:hypothetical protein C8Q75DRAFT_810890 [Abortiporus biennis]